jgi:hypothetical protein
MPVEIDGAQTVFVVIRFLAVGEQERKHFFRNTTLLKASGSVLRDIHIQHDQSPGAFDASTLADDWLAR